MVMSSTSMEWSISQLPSIHATLVSLTAQETKRERVKLMEPGVAQNSFVAVSKKQTIHRVIILCVLTFQNAYEGKFVFKKKTL